MELSKKEKQTVAIVVMVAFLLTLITVIVFVVSQKSGSIFKKEETTLYQLTSTEPTTVEDTADELEELVDDYTNTYMYSSDVITVGDVSGVTQSYTVPETVTQSNPFNVPQGTDAIVSQYVTSMNDLKNTRDFKMSYNTRMNVIVDEITGGNIAQRILQSFINDSNINDVYSFANGIDGSKGVTPNDILPPAKSNVTLSANDVVSAEVVSQTSEGYTIKMVLKEEHLTTNQMPDAHANCLPPLDTDMSDSGLTINSYDVTFSGSTIVARFDNQGRLIYVENTAVSPGMSCTGTAVITMNVRMHGDITTIYNITY